MAKIPINRVHQVKKKTKNGTRIYGYYRRPGVRVPLGVVGTPEFFQKYEETHALYERQATNATKAKAPGTFGALVRLYLDSPDFAAKSERTQRDYRRNLEQLATRFGHLSIRTLNRRGVIAIRNAYQDTPRLAHYMVQLVSIVCNLAIDEGYLTTNPARGVKRIKKSASTHRPWHDHEIAQFRACWALGTWERTAFELVLGTGQRGGDVAAMTRRQVAADTVWCVQSKTGAYVELPIVPPLQEALRAWLSTHNHDLILAGRGGTMKVDRFRHRMGEAFAAAGLDDLTTHGGRYTAATMLREAGADWRSIAAVLGHTTQQMAEKYSAQKRGAAEALGAIHNPKKESDQ